MRCEGGCARGVRLSVHERLVAGLSSAEELERGYLCTLGAISLLSVLGSCQ